MSIFDILPWWSWLFGTLGVAGVLALVILAPAAAAVAEQTMAAAIGRMLQTRIGVAVLVGALALFAGQVIGGLYVEGRCKALIESQRQAAAAAATQRDADIAAATEKKYELVIEKLQRTANARNEEAANYERTMLAAIAGGAGQCPLGADALSLRRR